MPRVLPDDLRGLPADERFELIEALWESLEGDSGAGGPAELSPEMLVELRRRMDAIEAGEEKQIPWEEVRAKLDARSR